MTGPTIIEAIRRLSIALKLSGVKKYALVVDSEEDRRKIEHTLVNEMGGPQYIRMPTPEDMKKGRQFTQVMGVPIVTKWEM